MELLLEDTLRVESSPDIDGLRVDLIASKLRVCFKKDESRQKEMEARGRSCFIVTERKFQRDKRDRENRGNIHIFPFMISITKL